MGILEAVIRALIYLCCVALAFFLCVWVLGSLGVALPLMVLTVLKIIFVLIAILILIRLLWPDLAGMTWFPPRGP
jgi:hypothetical protein